MTQLFLLKNLLNGDSDPQPFSSIDLIAQVHTDKVTPPLNNSIEGWDKIIALGQEQIMVDGDFVIMECLYAIDTNEPDCNTTFYGKINF